MGHSKATTATLRGASLSTEQKNNLAEVADLMLIIYQTLVDMRYVHPKALVCGPHEFDGELLAAYEKHGLDPAIIYLYSILPYIDENETDAKDFFQESSFFDHTMTRGVEPGRDPLYLSPQGSFEDEEGQYMYPWYTMLSQMGNHSPVMIYDAMEHRIWMVNQGLDLTDPKHCKGWYEDDDSAKDQESNWGDTSSSNWTDGSGNIGEEETGAADKDLNSGGSSEFWGDEDEIVPTEELDGLVADQSEDIEYDEGFEHVEELSKWERQEAGAVKNRNSLESVPSRAAGDVLRDINRWYRELKELPGQGEYSHWLEPAILRPLLLKNGWPDRFKSDQFEVDMARAHCKRRAQYRAGEPLRQVECFVSWAEYSDRDVERYKKDIAEAKTQDEEWNARFELWKAEERSERNAKDLRNARAKAEEMYPGGKCQRDEDLPLWELEMLRVETQWCRERVDHKGSQVTSEQSKEDPKRVQHVKSQHLRDEHKLEIYERALQAAKADAECLCSGRTFTEATGIKSLGRQDTITSISEMKNVIKSLEICIEALGKFALTVPQDAPQAQLAIKEEMERNKKSEISLRNRLERSEKWLIEHGNTD